MEVDAIKAFIRRHFFLRWYVTVSLIVLSGLIASDWLIEVLETVLPQIVHSALTALLVPGYLIGLMLYGSPHSAPPPFFFVGFLINLYVIAIIVQTTWRGIRSAIQKEG